MVRHLQCSHNPISIKIIKHQHNQDINTANVFYKWSHDNQVNITASVFDLKKRAVFTLAMSDPTAIIILYVDSKLCGLKC